MRWGEADRILTFYSLQLGKVRGIARGARRMKSRFGGMLEPFSSINLTFFNKRNDSLGSISHIDSLETFSPLRESLDLIWAASRMVALVDGVTADRDSNPTIYHTLLEGLRSLVRTDDPVLLTLLFQIHILSHSGFQPQVDRCASCGRDLEEQSSRFSPSAGGCLCGSCDRGSWDYCLPMSQGSMAFSPSSTSDTLYTGDAPESDGSGAERSGNHRRNVCEIGGRQTVAGEGSVGRGTGCGPV